jgi:uncharacterized protein YhdP
MTGSSAYQALQNKGFNTLEHQIQIATDTLNSVLAGQHRFDALPFLSLQLKAIDDTVIVLRQASLQHAEDKRSNIIEPVISQEMQLNLINAMAAQVKATGSALSCVLARVSGDTLAGRLAGRPSKKALEDLLGGIYEQVGVINKLAGVMLFANKQIANTLCDTSRAYVKGLCCDAIKNASKSGGK